MCELLCPVSTELEPTIILKELGSVTAHSIRVSSEIFKLKYPNPSVGNRIVVGCTVCLVNAGIIELNDRSVVKTVSTTTNSLDNLPASRLPDCPYK